MKDVARRAHLQGWSVNPPPTHPFNPLLSLRVTCAVPSNKKLLLVENLLDACWMYGYDVSDPEVVSRVASNCGIDDKELISTALYDKEIKIKLKKQTDEAIVNGIFGVPSTVIDGEIYWGSESDTMMHIEYDLRGEKLRPDDAMIGRWQKINPSANRKH